MQLPSFQHWVPWNERSTVAGHRLPGVYLLGQFAASPPGQADPKASEIIYVGETCRTLHKRWSEFHNAAFRQKKECHSGGETFAAEFFDNQMTDSPDWLYVAAYSVDMEEPRRSAQIRFVERWVILTYVESYGRLPRCNSK